MTVEDSNVVDVVGVSELSNEVVLTISDHLPWTRPREHLVTLEAKVNSYIAFIESGTLLEQYPGSSGRSPCIEVVFKFAPPQEFWSFFEASKAVLERASIGFRARTLQLE